MNRFWGSFYAGMVIGLGGLVNVAVGGGWLGALLFSLGLLVVLRQHMFLFTGAVCKFEAFKSPMRLLTILALNLLGTGCVGLLGYSLVNREYITQLCMTKLDKHPLIVIIGGIICGICIAIAVNCQQWYITILAVMCFILVGGEHCIANMFYFVCSGMVSMQAALVILLTIIGNIIGGLLMDKLEVQHG